MLPSGINYAMYGSTSGMSTAHWGPACWKFLFISIMGRYPMKINKNNKEHLVIQKEFKHLLVGLQHVLPCVFCRDSFKDFLKIIPIKNFLNGRIELMYWLYIIKDLVNNKLMNQEKKCYNNEKQKIYNQYKAGNISISSALQILSEFKKKTFVTIKSPPFKDVLDFYEKYRAVCSKTSLSCVIAKAL